MNDINLLAPGIWLRGINIPLIKIKGNFIREDSIIILDGLSVGGADKTNPNAEKQKEANIVLNTRLKVINPIPNKAIPNKKTKAVIKSPNKKDANISPKMIAHKDIGAETILSKVFVLVSVGAIAGPIEVDVKKSAMASKLGNKNSIANSLPKAKEINKNAGKSRPKITTGPFM
jgi:hypothetical protein